MESDYVRKAGRRPENTGKMLCVKFIQVAKEATGGFSERKCKMQFTY